MNTSNFAYRNYMTTHGKDIISNNLKMSLIEGGYSAPNNQQVSTNVPFLYNNSYQTTIPAGYTSSDLKTSYISNLKTQQFVQDFKIIKPQ